MLSTSGVVDQPGSGYGLRSGYVFLCRSAYSESLFAIEIGCPSQHDHFLIVRHTYPCKSLFGISRCLELYLGITGPV